MNYIWRWNDGGICVAPSRSKSREDCWNFVFEALRPVGMSDKQAEEFLHKFGEIVEDDET